MTKEPWISFASDLAVEVDQAYEQGLDLDREKAKLEVARILAIEDQAEREVQALAFYTQIDELLQRQEYKYVEPSDWPGIRATLQGSALPLPLPDGEKLRDRIRGAWLGRIAGCFLGKPFEGWRSPRYYAFLKETGQYPLSDYASFDIAPELQEKFDVRIQQNEYLRRLSRENICRAIEDDDTNYTVLGLKLLSEKGTNFTSDDVAVLWLANLPFLHVCTAERVAYRNLVRLMEPPQTAVFANPYREWIGAQIRADFFGYVNPGNPMLAAEMAWRDASISHIKNGIYGEMYMAAAISLAMVEEDLLVVLRGALDYIPPQSRLHEAILEALEWAETLSFEEAYAAFHQKWDENYMHHWCHTISNAQIVILALCYGKRSFTPSICRAVDFLLDTDCNGATAGSLLGALIGETAIPSQWLEPLHDILETGVAGYNKVSISEMAEKTIQLISRG